MQDTHTDQRPITSEINTAALRDAAAGLTLEERHTLNAHLVGGLAFHADPVVFAKVLGAAREFVARDAVR